MLMARCCLSGSAAIHDQLNDLMKDLTDISIKEVRVNVRIEICSLRSEANEYQ